MNTAFAATTETASAIETPESAPITIHVGVDFANNITLSDNFIRVAEGGSRRITWQLDMDPNDPRTIVFDNPAVRVLTSPDQTQPQRFLVEEPSSRSVTYQWLNEDPDLYQTSFAYRVHAVIINSDGSFTPLSTDPIIRNDPPPAP
jgi:hypothetical protein